MVNALLLGERMKQTKEGETDMFNIRFSPILRQAEDAGENRPDVDISETDKELRFSFENPGALRDDVKIWLENDILTVSGEKKTDDNDRSERLVCERSFGKFERSFRLPEPVDRNKVVAELVDGVLEIILPKAKKVTEIRIS
jgi:HSP20 family protein